MAQAQKKPKQPQDPYAQHGKQLASSAQRLRGWVGSDPARAPELADALVHLTRHRLLGHAYAAGAADAQESVVRAAQLLTANGPIGPYTSIGDATRYVSALIHLASTQFGLGVPSAAARTLTSLQDIQQQLREFQIEEQLEPLDSIWLLSATAAARLSAGDVTAANAYADDALARLAASGLSSDAAHAFLIIDVDRMVSDCRWAAGRVEEALSSLHAAKARYDALVDGRLREAGRLSPALMERLAEPLFGLYRDMADRLRATGESDLGLVTRRALVDLLRGLAGRMGDATRRQLASALADLANDLSAADRVEEAEAAAVEASALVLGGPGAESTQVLVAAARARALILAGSPGEAVTLLGQVLPTELGESPSAAYAVGLRTLADALRAEGDADAAWSTEEALREIARALTGAAVVEDGTGPAVEDLARGVVSRGSVTVAQTERAAWVAAERAAAHQAELDRRERARVEAERRVAEQAEAERIAAEQRAAEQARAAERARREAERQAAAEEAERLERKRRREERLEQHRLEVEQREAERREAEMGADPAEAERLELERLQAELLDLERIEELVLAEPVEPDLPAEEPLAPVEAEPIGAEPIAPEPVAPELVEPEPAAPELVEPEPAAPEPVEPKPAAPELVEPEPVEPEPVEPGPADELTLAQQAWRNAKARGERKAARAANERVVELLRPRAQADLAEFGPKLYDALVELSSARLRGGDIWGSRAPAKEAKALAKTLGR